MIDWTVNLGHILTVGGFAGIGIGVIYAVRQDVAVLSTRLNPLEAAVVKLTDILERIGRHDERLKSVERDLERSHSEQKRRQSGSG